MCRASFKSLTCAGLAALACLACGQRYKTVNDNGVWWLVGPDQQKIFSLGVCVVDPGVSWDDYDQANLAYAGFRFYRSREAWAKDAVSNLTNWGFNTIGAWSDYGPLLAALDNHLYMTPILHMGSAAGAIWSDMWDPAIVSMMDDVAKGQIEARKKDRRIIGYFSDNEQGWWKGSIFKFVWMQKTHGTRDRAVDLLKKRYNNDWSKLTADFEADGANSFVELMDHGILYLKPGSNGVVAASEILQMIADRYYSLCRDIIKKYDPNALYLGDRFISNYYPEVAAVAGKYCDVVSTNLNADWKDGSFVRFHLDALEALTHKPLMVTEYYMTAKENGTGDPNNSSDFPVVDTQEERAKGFTNTTTQIASCPALVGAHWFQYYDEPENGRGDGEELRLRPGGRPQQTLWSLDSGRAESRLTQGSRRGQDPKGLNHSAANRGRPIRHDAMEQDPVVHSSHRSGSARRSLCILVFEQPRACFVLARGLTKRILLQERQDPRRRPHCRRDRYSRFQARLEVPGQWKGQRRPCRPRLGQGDQGQQIHPSGALGSNPARCVWHGRFQTRFRSALQGAIDIRNQGLHHNLGSNPPSGTIKENEPVSSTITQGLRAPSRGRLQP